MPAYWTIIERTSAVVAIPALPYLVHGQRKRKPDLRWEESGSSRSVIRRDNETLDFGQATFSGSIKNRSLEANTVQRIYLVVWRTPRRKATRRFGYGECVLRSPAGEEIGSPFALPPRQSFDLTITFEFPLQGTADETLFEATVPLSVGSRFLMPRYQYELAFEDVSGNLFDDKGKLRSRRSIGLHWTLDNAWEQLKDGHPLALLRHLTRMWREDATFAVRRAFRALGL